MMGLYTNTPTKRSASCSSLTTVRERDQAPKGALASLHGEIYSFAGEIVEQAKKLVDAATSDDYEGPSAKLVQAVVDGGIEALPDTLAPFGDFGIYAWCSRLQVVVKQRPKVDLSSPRVDLNGVKVHIDATGELWAKYPWWNCYRWCTKWEKVHKCKRIASVSPALEIAAEAHATAEANGPRVYVRGAFDKLRLDYPILEKIPLEGLANRALGGKRVLAYDASQLITTVPVLQSRFAVETLSLPTSADSIGIGVTIRKI